MFGARSRMQPLQPRHIRDKFITASAGKPLRAAACSMPTNRPSDKAAVNCYYLWMKIDWRSLVSRRMHHTCRKTRWFQSSDSLRGCVHGVVHGNTLVSTLDQRMLYTRFRLAPKSMTSDDLEWPKRHSCRNKQNFRSLNSFRIKIRAKYSGRKREQNLGE